MLAKKQIPVSVSVVSALAYRKELDSLYARRSAIDTLIESLLKYDRCRKTLADRRERQPA
jgi:hypothetical protein